MAMTLTGWPYVVAYFGGPGNVPTEFSDWNTHVEGPQCSWSSFVDVQRAYLHAYQTATPREVVFPIAVGGIANYEIVTMIEYKKGDVCITGVR